eukprot:TRINITY_DN13012_c0_g1_i1.p4 TRINITY_DN13012_c0_g1~~TRINITY_DN13012_c0_g1_i1.p4  ORF type:complete len:141 (+),score=82.96 TRINITY_DN13012_c0_g1_i1:743-1165(+)
MQKHIEWQREYNGRRYLKRPRHTIQIDQATYMEDLSEEVGCTPSLLNWRTWPVAWELLNAPQGWPLTYRLCGPGRWDGAAAALKRMYRRLSERPQQLACVGWEEMDFHEDVAYRKHMEIVGSKGGKKEKKHSAKEKKKTQ